MTEHEKWERLMASIRRAAKLLGIDLTELDIPEYLNWFVAARMSRDLWAKVRAI